MATIRKATPKKSLRVTWGDGRTSLNVSFQAKGAGKSQVVVQHVKLHFGSSSLLARPTALGCTALHRVA